jgi:hypothetical protein
MIKLPAASWEIWEIGNIEEITGSKPFYYTVKLFVLAADRTDGSRWAAAVNQPSPEAEPRGSWIGRGARSAQLHPVR